MKGDIRPPSPGPFRWTARIRWVVPVISAVGGVGRSTVAVIVAAALHHWTADHLAGRCPRPWE